MEQLMQFVWQHRLGLRGGQTTVDGRRVCVVDQGILNADAGPDFFNATVEIDGQTWVGNVEIHVRASDWIRHHHDADPAYDSVILHVVQVDDAPVYRSSGELIPQMIMRCTPEGARRCNLLINHAGASLPCSSTIASLPHIYHTDWLTSLGAERLYMKSERIRSLVDDSAGNWEAAAFVTLARALGFGLNSEPMEILARQLPLKFLNRHRDELTSVEAFMFGQAGLIPPPDAGEDPYITRLRDDYRFFSHKYSLRPLALAWKMARTRPQNFPHRRIAALAQKVHEGFYLMSSLVEADTIDRMRQLFDITLRGFWATHYTFAPTQATSPRALSRPSIDTLIINAAVPLRHAYATYRGDDDTLTSDIELLQAIEPENNSVTRLFADAGIEAADAFDSQALIQLRREYCEKRKCIYCRFGHRMLSAEISR